MASTQVSFQLPDVEVGEPSKAIVRNTGPGRLARPTKLPGGSHQGADSYELPELPRPVHFVAPPIPLPRNPNDPSAHPSRLAYVRYLLRRNYLRHSMGHHVPIVLFFWHATAFPSILLGDAFEGSAALEPSLEYGRVYAAVVGGVMIDFPFMIVFAVIRSGQMCKEMGNINSSVLAFVQLIVPYALLSYPIGTAVLASTNKDWGVHSLVAATFSSLIVAGIILVCLYFIVLECHMSSVLYGGNKGLKNRIAGPVDFLTLGTLGRLGKMDKPYVPGGDKKDKKGKGRAVGDLESQPIDAAAAAAALAVTRTQL